MMWRLLIGILLLAGVAAALVSWTLVFVWQAGGGHVTLDEMRVFLDAYKAIGLGFVVALVAVVIPQMLPEARDGFERFQRSRVAYSRAKTSVIYLPEKLATVPSFAEAVKAIQGAHRDLHLAETYPRELREHLDWHPYPRTWVDRNYWELFAMREVLDLSADGWSTLTASTRLQAIRKKLTEVDKVFGRDNERWSRLKRPAREREIEDALKSQGEPDGPTKDH